MKTKKTSQSKKEQKKPLTEGQKTTIRGVLTLINMSHCPLSFQEVVSNISGGGQEHALDWLMEKKLIKSKVIMGRKKDTTITVYFRKE